jgi:hypothetical protein
VTTHEADRPADPDAIDADPPEPVEDEHEMSLSREHDAFDEGPDEAGAGPMGVDPDGAAEPAEPQLDEVPEPAEPQLADDPDRVEAAEDERGFEPDPVQKLAPVGPDTALDPGTGSYQHRWDAIQAGFIDDPHRTVESASALVAELWDETVRALVDEREAVDGRWQNAESSTDDFREAMQEYRALYARYTGFAST